MSKPDWKLEQEICVKHNLRQCSMNRCCNAQLIVQLKKEIDMIADKYLKLQTKNKATVDALVKISKLVIK